MKTRDEVDEAFIRRAVEGAELNAVRMALYQATGDPEVAAMKLEYQIIRGGAARQLVPSDEDRERLVDKAVDYLLHHRPESVDDFEQVPDDETVHRLLEMCECKPIEADKLEMKRDLLAYEWFPREVDWTAGRPDAADDFHVVVTGAGFSGIAMGLHLQLLDIPYTIIERRHELGGTWSRNTYPDARVDTLSATYQYSFEKRYPWTEYFARQDEVRSYIEHVARKYGIFDHIVFDHDLTSAIYDERTDKWRLEIDVKGETVQMEANAVVSASGLFAAPRTVDIAGADDFAGELVHSTEWTSERTAEGKRVAVIGNGSTGVQLLGAVAEVAEHVSVFQRTPQWISPRERYGEPISEEETWLDQHMPYFWHWNHYTAVMPLFELFGLLVPDPEWQANGGHFNERNDQLREILTGYIESEVGGRTDLIEKLVPDYAPMARRPVVDNGWYRALVRENVELVTDPIERLTEHGVVTADGTEREVDMVIAAIGFDVNKYTAPAAYRGVNGLTLHEMWDKEGQGARAHLSLTVPDFPNLFIMYGPNSQPISGGNALPQWFEIWSRYIARSFIAMIENGHSRMEVRRDVYEDYNQRLAEASKGLIYESDEKSKDMNYYVGPSGRLLVNMPWQADDYHEWIKEPDLSEFHLS